MNKIYIPKSYNYIGVFLTFACNMSCSYCINDYRGAEHKYRPLKVDEWIRALNRIVTRDDLPITLQGGEPTCYKDFYRVVNGVDKRINLDLLTNGKFDVKEFIKNVPVKRFHREAPYASIRFSYHPGYTEWIHLLANVVALQKLGYSVGVWGVYHPLYKKTIRALQRAATINNIDFRIKEFLGYARHKLYGTYKYPKAVTGKRLPCKCKPSEMLIAPNGDIHRCHSYLYNKWKPYANILDKHVALPAQHFYCGNMGLCNPCDIKLKFDRFQREGHCSVDILE